MSRACVLFDLDGTLTDADHLHFAAFNQVLGRFGRAIELDYYKLHVMGHANPVIFEKLFPGETDAHPVLADEKEASFRQLAAVLHPAEGLLDLLAFLRGKGVPHGIVTNAPRANAVHELQAMGLGGHFQALVIGEELPHAKPHPLPYLTGLALMDGAAEQSLAFEDSLSGLRSAMAAGLAVVGLTTSLPASTLLVAGAALAIADFTDVRLRPLLERRLGLHMPASA